MKSDLMDDRSGQELQAVRVGIANRIIAQFFIAVFGEKGEGPWLTRLTGQMSVREFLPSNPFSL